MLIIQSLEYRLSQEQINEPKPSANRRRDNSEETSLTRKIRYIILPPRDNVKLKKDILVETPMDRLEKLNVIIRQEQACDYDVVYQLVKESFLTENHTEEPDYLNALRTKSEFIPELSLVAETEDGTIVGQIVLYQTTITYYSSQNVQLVVSPLSVSPKCFRRGVGSALLHEGLKIARKMGYKAASSMGRSWPDYPHITIKEVTHIVCDEALCKLFYLIHSVPPENGESTAAPFDADSYSWVRLVDGIWLNDKTTETYKDGFSSTHRK